MPSLFRAPVRQHTVSLSLLLLLLLPTAPVQAQPRAASDTSWMPATTTTTPQQPAAVPMRSPGSGTSDATISPLGRRGAADATAVAGTAGVKAPSAQPSSAAAVTPASAGAGSKAASAQQAAGPKAKAAAANPAGSLHNLLAKQTPLFRSLFTVLDIGPEQVPETAVGTFFAPSDEAITAFLQGMGMTPKQLAARPELVDLMLSYHFAPGYQVRGAEDVAAGTKILLTGDEQFILNISSSQQVPGQLTLSDVQRSKANVVDGPMTPQATDGISVYVIDKVLRSGNYFLTLSSALGHSPYWISAKEVVGRANILSQLEGQPVTMLVPDNAAFKPFEANLSRASTGRLADILRYHVLPKVRRLPKGFQQGPADTLLKGHTLDINITSEMQSDPFSGNKNKTVLVPLLTVTPEVGRPAKVSYYNIYAGPAILHGIGGLLMPDLPPDAGALPAPRQDPTDLPSSEGGSDQAEDVGLEGPDSVDAPGDDNSDKQPGEPQSAAVGRSSSPKKGVLGPVAGIRRPGMTPGGVTTESGSGKSSTGPAAGALAPGTTAPGAASTQPAGGALRPAAAAAANGMGSTAQRLRAPVGAPSLAAPSDGAGNRRRLLQLPMQEVLAAGLQRARQLLAGRVSQAGRRSSTPGVMPQGGAAPSGALSSVATVGSMGEMQSFANGIATNKTLIALARAAVPKVPREYVNRYGGFKGPDVKGGCLNCKAWGKQTQ